MSSHPGPWFCGVTLNWGNNDLQEIWGVHADEATARTAYDEALQLDNLHCACIGPIIAATEPHWVEIGGV